MSETYRIYREPLRRRWWNYALWPVSGAFQFPYTVCKGPRYPYEHVVQVAVTLRGARRAVRKDGRSAGLRASYAELQAVCAEPAP